RDELIRSSRTPCSPKAVTPDTVQTKIAGGTCGDIVPSDCGDNSLDPSTKSFECVEGDTDVTGVKMNRCLQRCCTPGSTEGCRAGRICVDYGSNNFYCADAAPVTSDCVNQYMSYQVGVGRAFLLSGSQIGLPATGRAGADGTCERDPTINPQLITRV